MDSTILPTRIKELRNTLNLTQKDFAASINISTVSVSSYETGTKTPSLEIVISIAKKYNVSLDWLCGLSNNKSLEKQIETYADFIKEILFITNIEYKDSNSYVANKNIDVANKDKITIVSHCPNVTSFFKEYEKMTALLYDRTIDRELFDLWLNKQYEKLNKPIKEFDDDSFDIFDMFAN